MTPPAYTEELSVALRLAEEAAAIIRAVYATGDFTVDRKADGSPVTVADQRADAHIVAGLRAAFPADAVLSEEAPFADAPDAHRLWMVDPLDGTRDFAGRTGDFAVMIGLCVAHRPVLGVVAAPALRRTWAGVVGHGAFERGPDGGDRPLRLAVPGPVPRVL
ncbi:MAG: 3'(2'),5'-bisphosphate nucleotidase CysQ, partial [Myxococcales bacterium]|nr:3'(2'),5'-bisphosphate nucleotidase CysQ [Myxococcales bacterium]